MSEEYKIAGAYQLISFEISSFPTEGKAIEMKGIVHTWNLEESITKGNIRGKAKIYDATGIFYNFPLRGQEKLKIVYKDFFDEERTEELFIYSITDINAAGNNDDSILEYVIHFTSFGKFWSDRYKVKRCIANGTEGGRSYQPIHEQVQVLFDDYYLSDGNGTKKEIVIHETDGDQSVVIPNYTPEEAMHLMTRRAYSAQYPSNMYRFFENRDKYYFMNFERWIEEFRNEEVLEYIYARSATDQTPEGELSKMKTLINLSLGSFTNTMDQINSGAYVRKVAEIDFQSRTISPYTYNHLEEFKDFMWPDLTNQIQLRHTDNMINEHMNKEFVTYVFKDYAEETGSTPSGLRPQPFYGEIHNNKVAMMKEYSQSRIIATMFGNNKIVAGSLIWIDIPMFKPSSESDSRLSGYYIVESINNDFIEDTYYQNVTLIKGPMLIERNENAEAVG